MVGQRLPTVNKPSRSDEVIDPDHQLLIADQVKAHFDSLAPKRPIKPSRSEPDPDASVAQAHSGPIPELHKLHSLNSLSQVVFPKEGNGVVSEEFVETEYYNKLVSIDKQHHTTGNGFIRVAKEGEENGRDYDEIAQRLNENGGREIKKKGLSCGFKSNPATNDWIPSDDQEVYVSSKPTRSG